MASTPNIDALSLSDPIKDGQAHDAITRDKDSRETGGKPASEASRRVESRFSAEEAREAVLRAELESVRSINKVIEDAVASLEKAKSNMEVCISEHGPLGLDFVKFIHHDMQLINLPQDRPFREPSIMLPPC
jgi:hypothetical protein